MRSTDFFKDLKEVENLIIFLYSDEKNYVRYTNKLAFFELRINEDGEFYSKNENFPSIFHQVLEIPELLAIVEQLKEQPSEMAQFNNRWEEIKWTVAVTKALNKI